MSVKKSLPNFLTCLNLLCGCIGIVQAFQGSLITAGYLIWLAAALDFLDGFVARALHAYSEIGKQLDSLADMVTFGLLPSIILFILIQREDVAPYLPFIAFLVAVFSALRLAKFNIDTRQTTSFIGLPTPANALFISSFPVVIAQNTLGAAPLFQHVIFLVLVCLFFSYLLVAEIEMFSLKFKDFTWKNNKLVFIFLGISLLIFIAFKMLAVPIIILLYILLSVFSKKTTVINKPPRI